jgi:hypothetical protein
LNAQLFAEYISTVFILDIKELPSLEEFAGKEAVLLIDDCPVRTKPETLHALAEH